MSVAAFRALAATFPVTAGEVRVEGDTVAEIVLDAPATRNALHPGMMLQLADAVESVRDARVVILRGAGATFCSGGDLGAVRAHLVTPGAGRLLAAFMHEVTDRLAALDAPVIGVATGAALGGGAELLAACDLVVAAPDARVGWVQARLGVSPGFGGGARLIARVGPRRALRILADARPLSADEAERVGLVDEVVVDPLAAARARASAWAALPAEALRAVKRLVRAAETLPSAEARRVEATLFDGLWGGPAHLAALDRAAKR